MARLLLSISPQPPRVAGGVPAVELLMVAFMYRDKVIWGTWVPLRQHFALASI